LLRVENVILRDSAAVEVEVTGVVLVAVVSVVVVEDAAAGEDLLLFLVAFDILLIKKQIFLF
jgi:hypothetical protein